MERPGKGAGWTLLQPERNLSPRKSVMGYGGPSLWMLKGSPISLSFPPLSLIWKQDVKCCADTQRWKRTSIAGCVVENLLKHTNPKSNAVPLQKALQEFVEALRSIPTFDESRALMVHCGDFDAKMLMKAWEECAQYSNFCDALSFDLPDLFQKWCKVNQCERPGVQCSRTDNFGQLRTRKSRRLWQKRWTGWTDWRLSYKSQGRRIATWPFTTLACATLILGKHYY